MLDSEEQEQKKKKKKTSPRINFRKREKSGVKNSSPKNGKGSEQAESEDSTCLDDKNGDSKHGFVDAYNIFLEAIVAPLEEGLRLFDLVEGIKTYQPDEEYYRLSEAVGDITGKVTSDFMMRSFRTLVEVVKKEEFIMTPGDAMLASKQFSIVDKFLRKHARIVPPENSKIPVEIKKVKYKDLNRNIYKLLRSHFYVKEGSKKHGYSDDGKEVITLLEESDGKFLEGCNVLGAFPGKNGEKNSNTDRGKSEDLHDEFRKMIESADPALSRAILSESPVLTIEDPEAFKYYFRTTIQPVVQAVVLFNLETALVMCRKVKDSTDKFRLVSSSQERKQVDKDLQGRVSTLQGKISGWLKDHKKTYSTIIQLIDNKHGVNDGFRYLYSKICDPLNISARKGWLQTISTILSRSSDDESLLDVHTILHGLHRTTDYISKASLQLYSAIKDHIEFSITLDTVGERVFIVKLKVFSEANEVKLPFTTATGRACMSDNNGTFVGIQKGQSRVIVKLPLTYDLVKQYGNSPLKVEIISDDKSLKVNESRSSLFLTLEDAKATVILDDVAKNGSRKRNATKVSLSGNAEMSHATFLNQKRTPNIYFAQLKLSEFIDNESKNVNAVSNNGGLKEKTKKVLTDSMNVMKKLSPRRKISKSSDTSSGKILAPPQSAKLSRHRKKTIERKISSTIPEGKTPQRDRGLSIDAQKVKDRRKSARKKALDARAMLRRSSSTANEITETEVISRSSPRTLSPRAGSPRANNGSRVRSGNFTKKAHDVVIEEAASPLRPRKKGPQTGNPRMVKRKVSASSPIFAENAKESEKNNDNATDIFGASSYTSTSDST